MIQVETLKNTYFRKNFCENNPQKQCDLLRDLNLTVASWDLIIVASTFSVCSEAQAMYYTMLTLHVNIEPV